MKLLQLICNAAWSLGFLMPDSPLGRLGHRIAGVPIALAKPYVTEKEMLIWYVQWLYEQAKKNNW